MLNRFLIASAFSLIDSRNYLFIKFILIVLFVSIVLCIVRHRFYWTFLLGKMIVNFLFCIFPYPQWFLQFFNQSWFFFFTQTYTFLMIEAGWTTCKLGILIETFKLFKLRWVYSFALLIFWLEIIIIIFVLPAILRVKRSREITLLNCRFKHSVSIVIVTDNRFMKCIKYLVIFACSHITKALSNWRAKKSR